MAAEYEVDCARCPSGDRGEPCPHVITVGWDEAMDSYFGRIVDTRIHDPDQSILLDVGTEPSQLPSVDSLQEALNTWAVVDDQTWAALERDGRRLGPGHMAAFQGSEGLGEDDDDLRDQGPAGSVALGRVESARERRSHLGPNGGEPGATALSEYHRLLRAHIARAVPKLLMIVLATTALTVIAWQFLPLLAAAIIVAGGGLAWRAGRVPGNVSAWRRGGRGEKATARLLGPLTRHGFTIFHDLAMPNSDINIDHLVIGPTGVWMIDSKSWRSRTVVDGDGQLWRGRVAASRTVRTAWEEAVEVARLFQATGLEYGVNPVLVVHGTPLRQLEAWARPAGAGGSDEAVRVVAPDFLAAVVSRPPVSLWPAEAEALAERVRVVFGLPRPAPAQN
jgi:hypothetical protein